MNQVSVDQNEQNGIAGHGGEVLKQRVEQVRDIVENVRDRAELAFRDKPYLVPVAAGVLGLGIGVLMGSKITRFILFTAVGSLLSDQLGGEIKRISGGLVQNLQKKLEEKGIGEGAEGSYAE